VEIKATDLGKNTYMLECQTATSQSRRRGEMQVQVLPPPPSSLSGKKDTDKGYRTISRAITSSGPVRRFGIS
jgi:hypothetical protein